MTRKKLFFGAWLFTFFAAAGCGDDDGESEAERRGVGAACVKDSDCEEVGQRCLSFKGGYCGIEDCSADVDCPAGSACVSHTDGGNYCFLLCSDKPQCNRHRSVDVESNCSANITFTDENHSKACVPPS